MEPSVNLNGVDLGAQPPPGASADGALAALGDATAWLNSPPLAASDLRGRVVLAISGPTRASTHGIDVDERGAGTVSAPRLYQLVRQPGRVSERRFEIPFLDPRQTGLRRHLRLIEQKGPPMRSDIVPGGVLPDYTLPDHTGALRSLSDLQGPDPLVLLLARGHYCPKDHQQHLELAAFYSKVAVAYTQMVTISADEHHTLQEMRASVGAQWTFLSDPGRVVQKDLDIKEYTDPENDPMIPHTLVLTPGLVVHSVYNGYWFWGRPSVGDLWHDLRSATRKTRPDWDLNTPGLREAWDAGDFSRFHGWDRRARQQVRTT